MEGLVNVEEDEKVQKIEEVEDVEASLRSRFDEEVG